LGGGDKKTERLGFGPNPFGGGKGIKENHKAKKRENHGGGRQQIVTRRTGKGPPGKKRYHNPKNEATDSVGESSSIPIISSGGMWEEKPENGKGRTKQIKKEG